MAFDENIRAAWVNRSSTVIKVHCSYILSDGMLKVLKLAQFLLMNFILQHLCRYLPEKIIFIVQKHHLRLEVGKKQL